MTRTATQSTFPAIDAATRVELRIYAAARGKDWKDALKKHWQGPISVIHFPDLKKTHGEAWLDQFELSAPKIPTMPELAKLDANAWSIRHIDAEKKRPPRFESMVEIIAHYFPDLDIHVDDWSEQPYVKQGRLRRVTGATRYGRRLILTPKGGSPYTGSERLFEHKTTGTYSTNWNILRWIVDEARRRKMKMV